MADPFGVLFNRNFYQGRPGGEHVPAALISHTNSLFYAASLIQRHRLNLWFEPDWHSARKLARMSSNCFIYSIPVESFTYSLWKVPGWRPKKDNGERL